MIDLTGTNNIPIRQTAVALGLFDGLHSGHQDVIHKAVDFIPQGFSPAVFTFLTDTITSKGDGGVDIILSNNLKFELLERLGVEYIYSPDFLNFKDLTAQQFVRMVLRDKLRAKYVICGEDFRFGKGALCGYKELNELCNANNIEVIIIPPTIIDGEIVSSTRIRNFIKAGDITAANRLLGYDFQMKLRVVKGNQLGRTLNFPTINQYIPARQIVPLFGVYYSKVEIDGKIYKSITNIGIKPTIGGEVAPLSETFILGFNGDIYGQSIKVSLRRFIRTEKKFANINELTKQMNLDLEIAEDFIRKGI